MDSPNLIAIDESDLNSRYEEFQKNLFFARFQICCILSIVVIPFGFVMDWVVYPDLILPMFADRLAVAALIGIVLTMTRRLKNSVHSSLYLAIFIGLLYSYTTVLIVLADGLESSYYTGFILVLLGLSLLLPWSAFQCAAAGVASLIFYAGACWLNWRSTGMLAHNWFSTVFTNVFMQVVNIAICITATHYTSKLRYRDFRLQYELDQRYRELESTLTQLRETEAQLIQAGRLSALGSLSAGIMHEINNPVNYMMSAISFLRSELTNPSDDARETINDIEDGLRRIRDIIADLRSFAYGKPSEGKKECNPVDILRVAKRLLAEDLREDIMVEESANPRTILYCNQNQMVQLLVNLIQNSVHATRKNVELGRPRKIQVTIATKGEQNYITVRDNGHGIEKQNLGKIFDPFFTTKDVGEGTGLGLSIGHRIVKDHGGQIAVQSEPGQFTEFTVTLPSLGNSCATTPEFSEAQLQPTTNRQIAGEPIIVDIQ